MAKPKKSAKETVKKTTKATKETAVKTTKTTRATKNGKASETNGHAKPPKPAKASKANAAAKERGKQKAAQVDPKRIKSAAEKLEKSYMALSLSFRWLGTQRKLTSDQKSEAADLFDADDRALSASKKLFDTRHAAFKALVAIRNEMRSYWWDHTLPYPEMGVRLIPEQDVPTAVEFFKEKREQFNEAVENLNRVYEELLDTARNRLGRLYNPADYPASILGHFNVAWDFVSVKPDDRLMKLDPALYEEQKRRMEEKFKEAVALAEQAFMEEFAKLIGHLKEKLGKDEKGEYHIFRNSAVHNLSEFFDRFKALNLRSNPQLDQLVETAKDMLKGVDTDTIREQFSLREKIANQLDDVKGELEGMIETRPRRLINRAAMQKPSDTE